MSPDDARRNAEIIGREPEKILDLIHAERQLCGRGVITRVLERYVGGDAKLLRPTLAAVMAVHAEQEAGQVVETLRKFAERRRGCIGVGDAEGLRHLEAKVVRYQADLREQIRRDRHLENALRRRWRSHEPQSTPKATMNSRDTAIGGSLRL